MTAPLSVRRVVSATPLAAQHATRLCRDEPRPRRAIPWERFDRSRYPEVALSLAADQAQKLAEGEYGAVGLFGQIASGLALTRAPFDVISAAATIAGDEIRHADYCTQLAEACAGHPIALSVDADAVLRACQNLERAEEVDFFLLKYSAIGETLAAALLTECRRGASEPVARAVYTALASDEVHHARLGWYYFAWRAPQWSAPERQRLADRIGEFVVQIEREFWVGRDAPAAAKASADALGVLDSPRQRDVISAVMEEEIVPGLDALGLGGSHAWAVRRRGAPADGAQPARLVLSEGLVAERDPAVEAAADWLEAAVDTEGRVRFSIDPESGAVVATGLMHHGRAAVVLAALRAARRGAAADRVASWLSAEVDAALRGALPAAWPDDPRQVAATLALGCLAGCDFEAALLDRARSLEFGDDAWHAAQVVTALGDRCPSRLWAHCAERAGDVPFAPWTTRAARAVGDVPVLARSARRLLVSLGGIDAQGCTVELPAPPIALVAASVEALAGEDSPEALARIDAGRAYLRRWQFLDRMPPGVSAEIARGALPLAPDAWALRADVTAHALLALLAPV